MAAIGDYAPPWPNKKPSYPRPIAT